MPDGTRKEWMELHQLHHTAITNRTTAAVESDVDDELSATFDATVRVQTQVERAVAMEAGSPWLGR